MTLREAIQILQPHSDTARLDAELLLSNVLQLSRTELLAYPNRELTLQQQQIFRVLINRRQAGEPVAYLLGFKEFWSIELETNKHTLIPRPDTELLVELLLKKFPEDTDIKLADLGTGTGAIALALASERPRWSIFATDCSSSALMVAQRNAKRLALANVTFGLGNWCKALPHQAFDVIVSNPPYLAEQDPHLQQKELHHEPKLALIAGPTGLEAFDSIINQARLYLKKGGWLLLEHGFDQQERVDRILQQAGYGDITHYPDLAGVPRAVISRWCCV